LSFAILVFTGAVSTDFVLANSFDLVKEHWWMTFAYYSLLVGIIVQLAGSCFFIPAVILSYAKNGCPYLGKMDAEGFWRCFLETIYVVLTWFHFSTNFIQYHPLVAVALIYFKFNEIKNNEGTFEKRNQQIQVLT